MYGRSYVRPLFPPFGDPFCTVAGRSFPRKIKTTPKRKYGRKLQRPRLPKCNATGARRAIRWGLSGGPCLFCWLLMISNRSFPPILSLNCKLRSGQFWRRCGAIKSACEYAVALLADMEGRQKKRRTITEQQNAERRKGRKYRD